MLPKSNKHLFGSLTLISLYAVSSTMAQLDPCAAIAGNRTASFQDAMACLDYFKFDKDIAQQTVDTVRKVAKELYVFNVREKKYILYFIKRKQKN
jgi:hypothetical protein